MKIRIIALSCLALALIPHVNAFGEDATTKADRVVKIGAVGNRIKTGIFENLAVVLTRKGYPAKLVAFESYDAMVDALDNGEIDIAWNSPFSHVQYHVRNQCESQTLAMREGDVGLHVMLIAKDDSAIQSIKDLNGKRVIFGRQKYHEGLLSRHLLEKAGVDLAKVDVIRLDEKDAGGKRADEATHILQALSDGRGDAAMIPEGYWKRATQWRDANPNAKAVWKSPSFNHCVFTAAKDFDTNLGNQFTKLMTTLDPNDPLVAELNRLEKTRRWLPGDSKGFESLVEAIQEREDD